MRIMQVSFIESFPDENETGPLDPMKPCFRLRLKCDRFAPLDDGRLRM